MDTSRLFQFASRAFRDLIATLLTDERVPEEFGQVHELLKSLKSDLGRKACADRLGLNVEELGEFERCLNELAKRNKTGLADSANDKIACLRLLSWLETIDNRQNDYQLDSEIETEVSEDLSRKQVRALELVIRSLVSERHGSQHELASHLQQMFGQRTVERWSKVADAEDLLSGTTFSELASIFVNKDEFAHHQRLYEDADVANLLKERRKTVQCYLEDIRRVRNTLAHNKRVSDIQLTLLDLYYDQLISPVQSGYTSGATQVNPKSYFDVTDGEVQEYFSDLKQDVMSVKDDISDLKQHLDKQIDEVRSQGQEIVAATGGLNNKMVLALAILIPIGCAVGYGIYLSLGTNDKVGQIQQDTANIDENTKAINEKSDKIIENQSTLDSKTDSIASTTNDIAASTENIETSTENIEASTENIAAKTDRIAESTEQMRATNEKIMDSVSDIAESNQKIAQSIENMQDGFQSLAQAGGIIPDPKLPQEIYHNARLFEQRGDYANARKSYVRFFDFKLELIDPHLRFQSFLKLQEGIEGAREVYRTLNEKNGDIATTLAAILLEPAEVRTQRLADYAEQHPKIAPVFYFLSQEYSSSRLGTQDIGDKADEKKYLEQFLKLKDEGEFVKYMLDKSVADEQLKDAEQRLQQLARLSQDTLDNPVSLSGMMTNSGWMVTIQVTGTPTDILYRTAPGNEFKNTGHMQFKNQMTGKPMPNMTVNLDKMAGPTTFEIKYVDANGKVRGPFEIDFEPATELIASQKKILEMLPQSWISFRDFDGKTLAYFSHLLAYRNAIKEINYGLDKDTPDTVYKISIMTDTGILENFKEFDQGDPKNPGALLENELPHLTVPGSTKFITVKLKYLDGTESEIVRIER